MTKKKIKPLPRRIHDLIDKNEAFSIFGVINLGYLKSSTGTRLNNRELKKRICNEFAHQMVNNEIEFIN